MAQKDWVVPFKLNPRSCQPKFKQIVDGVLDAIDEKFYHRGDVLPSVSSLCREFSLARETVLRAYSELKERGVVESVPRKGYFVASESYRQMTRIFLLFDELSPYKQTLYNAFMEEIAGKAITDIYFHHCNSEVFKMLVLDNLGRYGKYVIMPFDNPKIKPVLEQVDPDKLLVFDRTEYAPPTCNHIGQEFHLSVVECLTQAREKLIRYQAMDLIFPIPSNHPREIMDGFKRFCRLNAISFAVVHRFDEVHIQEGKAYFVLDDLDLIQIVEQCKARGYRLGHDVGILSYNDTPMKRVIDEGITVISTDFNLMGRKAAQFVFTRQDTREWVPTQLIIRNSL